MKKRLLGQGGFTMVEVLVSMVILTVGLLGLAGLQIRSLSGSHSAYARTQAVQYAADMVDRMMANCDAAIAGSYNLALGEDPCDPLPDPLPVACEDLIEWHDFLDGTINTSGGLPGGQGSIAVDANQVATVVVQWDNTDGTSSSVQVQTKLQ